MYTLIGLGEPQPNVSCTGWESDPESFSKRVAEHYVRTVLGQSLRAWRIVPYYPSGNKKYMEVQFSPSLAVGVSFLKVPDYVIALRLRAQPPGPPRYYTYSCTLDGNLILKDRPKPSASPKNLTTLRMRAPLGEIEQTAGWFGSSSEAMNTMSSDIIGFAFGKADLGPAQLKEIDRWARSILAQETHKVRRVQLIGHTDPVGSPQYNKTLGQRRADIVREALIAALESKRPGSSKAIAITTDSAGELSRYPGLPPSAQRRVHVTAYMDRPTSPPPPSHRQVPPTGPPPPPRYWVPPPGYREPPRMGPAEPGAKYRGAITEAQILEERFQKAERSGDIKSMAEAAEAYYKLLAQFPTQRPGEPMPGRYAMERQREKELEARASIMRQAPNLASIVRNLGPLDLARLRVKIAEHVFQRVAPRRQRQSGARR